MNLKVGLISEGDESAYRDEILKLTSWWSDNNLALNTTKTKEIIQEKPSRPLPSTSTVTV